MLEWHREPREGPETSARGGESGPKIRRGKLAPPFAATGKHVSRKEESVGISRINFCLQCRIPIPYTVGFSQMGSVALPGTSLLDIPDCSKDALR